MNQDQEQVLAAVAESNEDEDCSGGEDDVQLRKRLQPEDQSATHQRASEGSSVGAIQSLGSAPSGRRSWASFTSNAASRSVAASVHQHRQQFLQHRARFNPDATSEAATPSVSKQFEIELRALGRGTSTPRSNPDSDLASWVKHGKSGEKSKAPAPFQRQGSVRMRVKSFDAMSGQ